MVNTHTASTLNLAPETMVNPDPVQPAGNSPPGPVPNPSLQVGRGGEATGGGGLTGGGGGGVGVNNPHPPTGTPIGKNPSNPMNFSLNHGRANLGVLD